MTYLGGWIAGALVRLIWEALQALWDLAGWIGSTFEAIVGGLLTAVKDWVTGGGIGRLGDALYNSCGTAF